MEGKKLTAEDFRDKIKPSAPPEFEVGVTITPEKLAAYINKSNLNEESFYSSGRSERVGNYTLECQCWIEGRCDEKKTRIRYVLKNYAHQGECNENGIIECRCYVFTTPRIVGWAVRSFDFQEGEVLICEEYYNSLLGFYDQMTLSSDGQSIDIYV